MTPGIKNGNVLKGEIDQRSQKHENLLCNANGAPNL